ncbi:MAG TPA: type II/IV secretion system protein [Gemmatimonadaceae bacterium]|nr:type II/IV secretion system protein [Gemmatimonadaceae bacterium]
MSTPPVRDAWLLPTLERLLTDEALVGLQASGAASYWEAAVRLGLTTDAEILAALASRYRMKIADLSAVNPNGRDLIPETLARRYGAVPVAITDTAVEVATADPTDIDCERALGFACGRKVRLTLGAPAAIAEAIELLYAPEAQAESVIAKILENVADKYDVQALTEEAEEAELSGLSETGSDRPVIKLVDYVVAEGITSRASDIHLEPEEGGVSVRYRIDGVLRQVMALPRAAGIPLVSRIKIISGLDIADRLRPQDGRARVVVNGKQVDLRVSTLPAAHGEKVVIRILDGGANGVSFEAMSLNADEMERLQRLLQVREGIILVTGPTGSGKTTTLYTSLRQIQQRGGVNIVTVEDPVEYRLPGIVQVQVNEKAGLTFAAALRSILRQDPDVVLVGEIRDRETAGIAVQASLTGHLVFSTLHTIDAASSVTRLVDIGVESYKIAAALKGVVAQRLLRRLCRACKRPAPTAAPRHVRHWVPEGVEHFEAVGCAECGNTGYRGRLPVMEVLIVDGEVERRISTNEPVDRIVEAARANGMRSLWESGVQHVLNGLTSIDELLRVLDVPADAPAVRATPARQRVPSATPLAAPPVPATAPDDTSSVLTPALFQLVDEPTLPPEVPGGAPRVLLVEDELPLRGVLRDLLTRDGFEVLEAGDGIEALGTIDRDGPDLVVLDLTLPRLDGYAVLTRLRTRRETQALPVLVLTAREDEEAEVRVFELGADDFLSKPFRPRALMARLRGLLRRLPVASGASGSLRAVG